VAVDAEGTTLAALGRPNAPLSLNCHAEAAPTVARARSARPQWVLWTGAGLTGGAAVATAVLWSLAAQRNGASRANGVGEPGHFAADAQRLHDEALAFQGAGLVSLAVGVAAAAVTGAWWWGAG
jgi:hypothetical protein